MTEGERELPHPFDHWVASMPATHWARYDLGACRLGWEVAVAAVESQIADHKREACDARDDADNYQRVAESLREQLNAMEARQHRKALPIAVKKIAAASITREASSGFALVPLDMFQAMIDAFEHDLEAGEDDE